MDLVVEVYRLASCFPADELYGLTNQVRRAAVSIPSNIAEGQGRGIGNEFARFLRISLGYLQEVQTQLLLSERLNYVRSQDLAIAMEMTDEVARVTKGLLASVTPNYQLSTTNCPS